jgi:hypothetical protein
MICVSNIKELKDKIFWEAHESAYSIHLGRNKKYHDLKAIYWWYKIKRDVVKYVSLCDRESRSSINDLLDCCNPSKYPSESGKRLLWILSWDCLGLSLENDSLWVIVDRLAMVAHFMLIKTTYIGPQLVEFYSSRIACFCGEPMRNVSDRVTQVILKFSESLHETLDTHWNFSSAYHPQTDGQLRE